MPAPDPELTALFAFNVWTYKQGEMVSLMIHLGDRLGLYRALAGAGPVTAADLAAATGYSQRWLLEWLRSQAAARLLESTDGTTFELTPEGASVLADEESSLFFAAGAFHAGGAVTPDVLERLVESFQTGVGLTYEELGPTAAHGLERMLAPWSRLALVPTVLPALDGVAARLTAGGARVADVGCGAGVALAAMAGAWPGAEFHGFDPSGHALDRARANLTAAGVTNVELHETGAEEVPDFGPFDVVVTLDVLHDLPRPAEAVHAVRRALADDGTWLVKDIRTAATWSEQLANPVLAMMYGSSVTACMSSALSEPGGAGLGTLGLYPELLESMCREAGFTRFRVHDFDDPANLYYEVRP